MTDEDKLAQRRANMAKARATKRLAPKSAFAALNPRYRLFVHTYVNNNFNGLQAAVAAGYGESWAGVQASKLLKTPKVQAAIRELLGPRIPPAEAVAARISEIAFHNPMELYGHDGQLDLEELKKRGHLVQEFDASAGLDKAKVKFLSQLHGLTLLGKIQGLFVERQEVSGPGGGPVQAQHTVATMQLDPEVAAAVAPKRAQVVAGQAQVSDAGGEPRGLE